jgi:hypothetical protein
MFHTFLGVRRPNQRGHSIFFRIPHGCRSRYVFLFDQELSSLEERGAAPRFSGGRRLRRSRIWMHKGIASGFEFRPPFSPPRDFSLIPVYRPLRSKGRATPRGCVRLFSQFLQCNHADPLGAKAEEWRIRIFLLHSRLQSELRSWLQGSAQGLRRSSLQLGPLAVLAVELAAVFPSFSVE